MIFEKPPHCNANFTEQRVEIDQMALMLKALGHPVRLRIVQELANLEHCCCADMCECFTQSQSTISQHLSVLKEAGIVDFEKDANKSCYSLNHNALYNIQLVMGELLQLKNTEAKDG